MWQERRLALRLQYEEKERQQQQVAAAAQAERAALQAAEKQRARDHRVSREP
jgi:hypothetical protein